MCEPATILTAASVAISAGSAYANYSGQKKAADQNKEAATNALHDSWAGLTLREGQEQSATSQSIMGIERQARDAKAIASLSAGESGVSGASVDALLSDITSQRLTAQTTERRNLDMTIEQLQREKVSGYATAASRIAGVPAPNPFLTGLQIAGSVGDAAMKMYDRQHPGGQK